MAMRRRGLEAVALLGAGGTFYYYRLRPGRELDGGAGAASVRSSGPAGPPVPRTSDGAPLQLLRVQVAFRHGARLPNQDVLHPGESANAGPAAWTAADATWDAAEGIPFTLRDYKGKELPGGAQNKRIASSSRTLAAGGTAGALSRHGWHQTIDLGATLRARYLGEPGAASLRRPGDGGGLPQEALLTRTTPIGRSVLSAQGVLTGLAPALLPPPPGTNTAVRLNRGPQWMVYNNFQCKRLSAFFKASMASDGPQVRKRSLSFPLLILNVIILPRQDQDITRAS
jgi:hypothetical protein